MAWEGLNAAVSGIFASKQSLYVTSHNMANVNNKTYSRQLTTQEATSPDRLYGVGMIGTGTTITDIYRVRDQYLNTKYWNENGKHGTWESRMNSIKDIETSFNEPTDAAIRKSMDEFFKAVDQLSTGPSAYANRSFFRESVTTFSRQFNELSSKLYTIQKELNLQVNTKVEQVNDFAFQISDLNKQIAQFELDSTKANDLRDKRDAIVDQLSKIVNVETRESNGKFQVNLGGITLVDHTYHNALEIKSIENQVNPSEKLSKIVWSSNGLDFRPTDGELKGILEVRGDGTLDGVGSGENNARGVAYYVNRLNEFASTFALKMNTMHEKGYGLNGSTGLYMMTVDGKSTDEIKNITIDVGGTPKKIGDLDLSDEKSADYLALQDYYRKNFRADNISLSKDITDNLDNIAAADAPNGQENGKNFLEILGARENKKFFDSPTAQGQPDDFLKAIISAVAVDSQQAQRMEKNEATIIKNILQRRMSDSGVSQDEEAANMVKFQHAYNANAKMINTMDQIFGVIVNQLGMAGR